jgi:hypothetical protein
MVGLRAGTYPLRRRCAREQAAAPEPAVATDLTMIRFWVTACSLVAMLALCVAAVAEERDIVITRENQRTNFTDAEIVDGFFKIVLGAEYHVAGRVDGVRKYDKPVRVYIDSRTKPDRRKQVAAVIADIRAKVKHLDIAVVEDRASANFFVTLVRDRDLNRTLVSFYGRERAKEIQRSLEPQCLSGFRKDETLRIQRSDVILVVDAGELIFYDCAYEEILQGLGPINDDDGIPWTMFNDDVQMGFFGVYDQYILNLLYHPRVKPGMKDREIREMLPTVLPEVRRWVAEVNGLKPQ